jgi:formate dehydrogenase subunit gamma
MTRFLSRVGHLLGVAGFLFALAIVSPVSAQQPSKVDPSASAVQEQQLLKEFKRVQGRITIPDAKEDVLIQPVGRDWQHFNQVTLPWIGGIVLLGILALLVIFYLWRGMVRIQSGRSGRTIVRFNSFERFVHWVTATCFIILAITGLNVTFGRPLFVSAFGTEAFSTWSQWAKYVHNYLSFPFTIGVFLIFVMWLAGNIPNKVDVEWFKRGGGIVGDDHPPAYRFNGGQKAIYWIVVIGGTIMAISGYVLMFPFYGTDIANMQSAQIFHGVVAMLFIAAMLGHIYIGTLGMEGAFEAMGEGHVDLNWAKEHHSLWVKKELEKKPASVHTKMTPAE